MKVVSPFEENLLRILRAILNGNGVEGVLTLLVREVKRPNCLGQDCVDLVQDDLAKGCVRQLSQWGWAAERFLNGSDPLDGTPVTGRLWERSSLAQRELVFSSHTLDWLIWITSVNFSQPAWLPKKPTAKRPLSIGDRIFLLLLFDALQETLGAPILIKHPAIRDDGLLWLLYPERFADLKGEYRGDFSMWLDPHSLWMLEAVQGKLVERWTKVELGKQKIRDPLRMQRLGEIQGVVLDHFFQGIDGCHRRDLARFCLPAARQVLHALPVNPSPYAALELSSLRMADRGETYQAALAFLNRLRKLQAWQQASTATSFYDEGYQASQFWKAEWERFGGDQICRQSREVGRQFELIPVSATDSSGPTGKAALN